MFSQKSRTKWILLLSVIAIVGTAIGVLRGSQSALRGEGTIDVMTGGAKGPAMFSLFRDGALVKQMEEDTGYPLHRFSFLPVGLYEVRIEGEGMVTLVKRGINVTPAGLSTTVSAPMKAGQGVHIVEYATGALSREQIADTLRSLEARIAKLEAK